ncbi:hypothetical protein CEXT_264971 [Caerostris extrusa]|uniref:Uncharacterized protein n=1 Tax=Caerostris extrusa TaxID=172846 RepID=A0AAV4NZ33_CAEEX|nr:hypothetical protein CEXT_264971 [Caerostris extrusa]
MAIHADFLHSENEHEERGPLRTPITAKWRAQKKESKKAQKSNPCWMRGWGIKASFVRALFFLQLPGRVLLKRSLHVGCPSP